MSLTSEERTAMEHAVGMDYPNGVKRNCFYALAPQVPMWESLCERGFAKLIGLPAEGHVYTFFMVTPEGYAALKAAMAEVAA